MATDPAISHDESLSDFCHSEFQIAKEWGYPVKELATVRNGFLRERVHFAYRQFRIQYSLAGLEELKVHLPPLVEEPPRPRYEGALPPQAPLVEGVVKVIRIWTNPRLMQVEDHLGQKFAMRCRMNSLFKRGMRINLRTQATWHSPNRENNNGFWEFSGKPPRFPGRW
jgi:hypothetical protein